MAHALMIGLIVIGNWIYFRGRKQGGQSTPAPDSWWSKFKRWLKRKWKPAVPVKIVEDLTKQDDEDTRGEA